MSDKMKKKMTKKEQKAANHAKLMASKSHGAPAAQASGGNTNNVIQLNTGQQLKKAA